MSQISEISNLDEITVQPVNNTKPPLWGSARLTYTLCAFLAMTLHLCLRNTINFAILYMVKPQPLIENTTTVYTVNNEDCGSIDSGTGPVIKPGNLLWSRAQEFQILGAFYYGYFVTLPIAGYIADKFGGKFLFVHSLTLQSIAFMLIPPFAHRSYSGVFILRIIQGFISGAGNPALYQLFSVWAHPSERTSFLSFGYGGFAIGTLLVFPISSFLCRFGWETAFYVVGIVSLIFGICCNWLVYNSIDDHPRLSKDEYEYLKINIVEKSSRDIPWKSIFTYVPIYAFIITHIFHSYGILVLILMIPRFFKEAMRIPLNWVGLISSAPFFGVVVSKVVTIFSCSSIEKLPRLNLSQYRRIVYVICNIFTIFFILGIILSDCHQHAMVVMFTICIGIATDMAFSGVYWPCLMCIAPQCSGLISGIANSLATLTGFLAPHGISFLVINGTKVEWNKVMATLMFSYFVAALTFGLCGSSNLAPWIKHSNESNKSDDENEENVNETQL